VPELLKALLVLPTIKNMEEEITLELLKALLVLLVPLVLLVLLVLLLLLIQSIAWKRHSISMLIIVCKHMKALSIPHKRDCYEVCQDTCHFTSAPG
jgi:hypothetical protein